MNVTAKDGYITMRKNFYSRGTGKTCLVEITFLCSAAAVIFYSCNKINLWTQDKCKLVTNMKFQK